MRIVGREGTASGQAGLPGRRISVFGSPSFVDGDITVPVTGHAGRLLAGLVERRAGVSLDALLDLLWPDEPPKSARAAFHVHMGRLRKLLDGLVAGPVVVRTGATYRLDLNGWVVDVDLFQSLRHQAGPVAGPAAGRATGTTTGRATGTTTGTAAGGAVVGDHGEGAGARVRMLGTALALSSAPAFVVDGESVAPSTTHLLSLARLDAEEEYVDALLADDQVGKAENMAFELVEAEPFREHRWAQLMRAQAMQGRAGDALATFRRARRRLVDELGVEPSDDLRQIQRLVLAADVSALRAPAVPAARAFGRVPAVLSALIGRDDVVDRLEAALARSVPALVLGAPGTGKTRVATEVACAVRERGVEVAWVDLWEELPARHALADDVTSWVRRNPGGLVVVDGAERDLALVGRLVGGVAESSHEASLLVASRVPLELDAATELLGPLALPFGDGGAVDDDDIEDSPAVRLFRDLLALRAPTAVVDSETARVLVERASGLPLGIRLMADLARTMPPEEVLERALPALVAEVRPAVEAILGDLAPDDRMGFAALTVVSGSLDGALIDALVGPEASADLATQLCEHGLLQYDETAPAAPYSVLEPLRDAGRAMLEAAGLTEVVLDRFVNECVRRAESIARPSRLVEGRVPMSVRLERELPWHRQAIELLAESGRSEPALRITAGVELTLYALGRWATNAELQDAALAIPGPPTAARATVHSARGRPGLLHEFDEAHLLRAIEIATALDEVAIRAKATYQLGMKRWWEGRFDEAVELYAAAGEMAAASGDGFIALEAQRYTGVVLVMTGRVDEGFRVQRDTLERAERSGGMEFLIPHMQMYIGHCRRHVGDDDGARVELELARASYERMTNTASLVHVYAALAEIAADRQASSESLAYAGRALELSALGGTDVYDPWVLCTVARVHASLGDVMAARHAAAEAVRAMVGGWMGETHRVAAELAVVASRLADPVAAARLLGLADATEDRRELPIVTPAERRRIDETRAMVAGELADGGQAESLLGASSTLAEAAARLVAPAVVS